MLPEGKNGLFEEYYRLDKRLESNKPLYVSISQRYYVLLFPYKYSTFALRITSAYIKRITNIRDLL